MWLTLDTEVRRARPHRTIWLLSKLVTGCGVGARSGVDCGGHLKIDYRFCYLVLFMLVSLLMLAVHSTGP